MSQIDGLVGVVVATGLWRWRFEFGKEPLWSYNRSAISTLSVKSQSYLMETMKIIFFPKIQQHWVFWEVK